ncbi:hypothetical protein KO481_08790 [Nocardia sp. NEAU-G5]|uniref:Uncharacterized protein n=1 Tax=Nocardia albiluteola TaxID=2842303 RepID=A0ABS6AXA2_9NOCA|nr:hypothetical protein [Nocardia albiluteola]MBU3061619.1 hypothetical protein [Nocardia albiluteola]
MMSNSCVVDSDAVRRLGAVARRACREIDGSSGAELGTVGLFARLVPHSVVVHAWCESASTAADLVQRSADRFGRLAEHTDRALSVYLEADLAHAGLFAGLEVRI